MKRMLSTAVAVATFAIAQQAYAVDFCVGTTDGVANTGNGTAPAADADKCVPSFIVDAFPDVNQANQNTANNGSFTVTTSSGSVFVGPLSGHIGHSGVAAGTNLIDRFLFVVPQNGTGDGSITAIFRADSGIRFLEVLFNGVSATLTNPDPGAQLATIPLVNIVAGVQNILSIRYDSRGDGAYGGDIYFAPTVGETAVPEPATWAMMLAGFGAIGFAMRRRRQPQPQVRFAF